MDNNKLRIITWNTFAIPIFRKYSYKLQKIKEFITLHKNDTDIICLNEVFDWKLGKYNCKCTNSSRLGSRLISMLCGIVCYGNKIKNQKEDIIKHAKNCGFIYSAQSVFKSTDKLKILDGGLLILSKIKVENSEFINYKQDKQQADKGFIATTLVYDNNKISLISTHLTSDCYFSNMSNNKIRQDELKCIKLYLDRKNIIKYIVCGDMNIHHTKDYNDMIKTLDVQDNNNDDITHICNERYDYIFATHDIGIEKYKVFTDSTTVASDHRPVRAELTL